MGNRTVTLTDKQIKMYEEVVEICGWEDSDPAEFVELALESYVSEMIDHARNEVQSHIRILIEKLHEHDHRENPLSINYRNPRPNDIENVGFVWINPYDDEAYILIETDGIIAKWKRMTHHDLQEYNFPPEEETDGAAQTNRNS